MSEQEATLDEFVDGTADGSGLQSTPTGTYTLDWKIVRGGEYFSLRNGEFLSSDERDEDAEYPVYGGNGIMGFASDTNVKEGTIVIGRVGAHCGNVHRTKSDAWVTDNSIILNDVEPAYEDAFLKYLLANLNLGQFSEQSAQPRISQSTVENLRIPQPPIDEQRKIASVLYTVDQAIQKSGKIIEQRRRIRDAFINELLTQGYYEYNSILRREDLEIAEGGINTDLDRTSVGGIPEEWDTVRLENVIKSSLYGVAESAEDYQPDAPRYIRITDISEDGRLKDDELASLPDSKFDDKYLLSSGEILFARSGATVGKAYLYRESDPRAVYGGYLIRFVPDPNKILPEYLFYYTQSKAYENWVTRVTRKGAQENINAQEYSSILLPLPSIEEQKKIVEALRVHRDLIQHELNYQNQLQRLKQGLMQDLLSGEVRTHNKDIEIVDDVLQHG